MTVHKRSPSRVNMKEYARICKNMQERANFLVVYVRGSRTFWLIIDKIMKSVYCFICLNQLKISRKILNRNSPAMKSIRFGSSSSTCTLFPNTSNSNDSIRSFAFYTSLTHIFRPLFQKSCS